MKVGIIDLVYVIQKATRGMDICSISLLDLQKCFDILGIKYEKQ